MVSDVAPVLTDRLILTPVGLDDLDAMAELHADPRVWRHFPSGRHRDREQTRAYLVERERQWRRDGLGYWTVRSRAAVGNLSRGDIVGIGGCAVPDGRTWWNLYYRLRPEVHRHGVAVEVCRAGLDAAHAVDQALPVTAFLLEHNVPSRATAERVGLQLVWRGPDSGNPDASAVRLIYADRPLDAGQTQALLRARA